MFESALRKKDIEILILWIIPALVVPISYFYWMLQGKLAYLGYLWVVPTVFTAIFVGIAAGRFGLWRWNNTIFCGAIWIHRPLVYAAYFNLVFLLTGRLLVLPTTISTLIEGGLVIGIVGMVVGVLHDLFGVEVGLYKQKGSRFDREKYGTVLVLSRYAFYFFGSISVAVGMAAKVGHYYLYESSVGYLNWFLLGVLAGTAITPPFLAWSISKYLVLVRKRKQWS